MGILQKKCRTTGKKALAYRGKGGQNTDTAFLALSLKVVLYLLKSLTFVGGHVSHSPQNTKIGYREPCVPCAVIQIARLVFL